MITFISALFCFVYEEACYITLTTLEVVLNLRYQFAKQSNHLRYIFCNAYIFYDKIEF